MRFDDRAPWPVDLDNARLWPMEGDDGPLLQELFDDLVAFRTELGEPGHADAVGTFLALPEGRDYDSKLLVGIWRNQGLAGVLDCIMGYPNESAWTIGLLVIADRHRRVGVASSVVDWLERTAAERETERVRIVVREGNDGGLAFTRSRGYTPAAEPSADVGYVVVQKQV